ncbi:hypothetical protein DUNSADRAFT_11732 [Dunaliella salina]|uniref:Encoded protein n=1 Tax=Dunaliella salina TaxID=3046 RepID=A0ABQ7GCR1_DUNSA|nr:hypothetical protein DUNSADRAFT_11732 [Dunaliella salina]|eukprot:KAF5832400.1 hypothetical protein DUNSADRAFT_11732 [Dunaliella salina]
MQTVWKQTHRLSNPCPAHMRVVDHRPRRNVAMRNFSQGTSDNPQNVENARIMPNASFSPSQAVQVQLNAVAKNDDPWFNHGIQTMYEFAEDTGSMERSWYFVTLQKDLYHVGILFIFMHIFTCSTRRWFKCNFFAITTSAAEVIVATLHCLLCQQCKQAPYQ